MHTEAGITGEYAARLERLGRERDRGLRTHGRFAALRIAIVVAGLVLLWRVGPAGMAWLLLPLAVFVVVAFLHGRALTRHDRITRIIAFYEQGLARIQHAWIGRGRTGDEFRQTDHLYADDLDIFGRGSLFELLATTRTHAGEETLARWLLTPAPHDEARSRQSAVRELAGRLDLREAITGLGDEVTVAVDAPLLRRWATAAGAEASPSLRAAVFALSLLTAASLLVWWNTSRFGWLAVVLLVAQVLVAMRFRERVASIDEAVDQPAHDLDVLAGLLHLIERERFTSPHLTGLQQRLGGGAQTASQEIARLSRLVALLASRRNVMFALPAALVMWTTQCAFAIEAWKYRVGTHIPRWLDVVGEFEALLALGTFSAEHPDYAFPILVDGPAQARATALSHPALGALAVDNDLALGAGEAAAAGGLQVPHLLVVSGSNMSGKSTWMRTVGVAVVLARMGAPVRARAMTISALRIGASIRVQDSLADGKSRFFAEVIRLKAVVDLARATPGSVLFLLDEVLGGTNSHDRRIGAEAVMTSLVEAGAIGIVTTHDLALAPADSQFGGRAANAHFEDQFEDGRMVFDYRLKPGVVRTSNALALMRSVGLAVEDEPRGPRNPMASDR